MNSQSKGGPATLYGAQASGENVESDQDISASTGPGDNSNKLIPEWSESEDNQIIWFALALLAFAALFGYGCSVLGSDNNALTEAVDSVNGGRSDINLIPLATEYGITAVDNDGVAVLTGEVASEDLRDQAGEDALAVRGIDRVDNQLTVAESAATTTTTEAIEEDDPALLSPDVNAAVADLGINGAATGSVAILTGVVDNADQSAEAETRALAVPGIDQVDNRLTVLQPSVQAALEGAKVKDAEAEVTDSVAIARGFVGNDLEREAALNAAESVAGVASVQDELVVVQPGVIAALTASGVEDAEASVSTSDDGLVRAVLIGNVASEEEKAAAVAAAAAVAGVDEVVDQLVVVGPTAEVVSEAANDILEKNPIQFQSGSATILDESFATLDEVVAALNAAPPEATFEVQGFTDVAGPEDSNLSLSQRRAEAVQDYLVSKGIASGRLTPVGYGETQQFADGTTPEALEANRRVQIEAK